MTMRRCALLAIALWIAIGARGCDLDPGSTEAHAIIGRDGAVADDSRACGQGLDYYEKWFWRAYDKARAETEKNRSLT